MTQTFVFEELDETTRNYLISVRDSDGVGAPGIFARFRSAMAGWGCLFGPLIIALTLALTLTNMTDLVFKDPVRVAFLQTAGIVLGGWLLFAGLRSRRMKGGKRLAGNWVYLDALHVYEGYREQVKITRIDEATEASFTHNYSNGAYQNSVVNIVLGPHASRTVAIKDEKRAEQMVIFVNYLAWARSPDGGNRAALPPASLGGLAKYVAKNDAEPKDAEDNINLNLVELAITEVPEGPAREGRAMPSLLPYLAILIAGAGIFYAMAYIVNPPIRDEAIYKAVIKEPCEPLYLRAYLHDDRNTRHREDVQKRLAREYDDAIQQLRAIPLKKPDPLREGMIQILDSLKSPEHPAVSLKVSETGAAPGAESRVTKLRDGLVGKIEAKRANPDAKDPDYYVAEGGIVGGLCLIKGPVQPPDGIPYVIPRTPVGLQLIEFAQMPEDARHAHFEVAYQFIPSKSNPKLNELQVVVEVRTKIDGDPVAVYKEDGGRLIPENQLDAEIDRLRDRLVAGLVGRVPPQGGPGIVK